MLDGLLSHYLRESEMTGLNRPYNGPRRIWGKKKPHIDMQGKLTLS